VRPWAALALCVALAWPALRGEDVARADAIWEGAQQIAGDDLSASAYVDAAALNSRVAPWQEGWGRARERVAAVATARRAKLVSDRGARRDGR